MTKSKQYDVLEIVPKKQIFKVCLRSLVANLILLLKWLFECIRCRIHKTTIMRRSIEQVHFPNMQPNFMTESNMGRHSYVKIESTKFHYVEAGNRSNPTILLLHGFPDCWFGWRYQITVLSQYFHVIVLDLKGFNDSDKPLWRFHYVPKTICEELRKFLIAISAKSVTIVGHDLGAIIGWMFAHTNPEMVDKFVSVSTPHPNLLWDNLPRSSPFNRNWLELIQLPILPEMEMQHNAERTLKKCYPHIQKDRAFISGTNGSVVNNLMEGYKYTFSRTEDWRGPLNYYRNFMFFRIKDGETLQCPCLIITGNKDRTYKLESVVKSSDYCDNFVIKIIEHSDHAPHQEMSTEFNSILLTFLIGKRLLLKSTESAPTASSLGLVGRVFGGIGAVANNTVRLGNNLKDGYTFATSFNSVPNFMLKS